MDSDKLSNIVIGCGINVHRALGPGLLESAYEECLAYEFAKKQIRFERQKALPVIYESVRLDWGFRLDFLIEGILIVELKAIEQFAPIHTAQVLTYLRLTGCKVGLILNFNSFSLRQGIKRVVLNF